MLIWSMPSIEIIALVTAVFLLALIPTRRLYLAGWTSRSLATYLAILMFFGLTLLVLRAEARILLPFVVVIYLAPFVTAPVVERLSRNRRGGGGRMPPRNVTPRDPDSGAPRP